MGVLNDVVKSFDTSSQQMQEITETLNLLVELTASKADNYKTMIEDSLNRGRIIGNNTSTDTLYFPITLIKDKRVEYRCVAENKPTDIIDKIASSISSMISDSSAQGIVAGVAKIIDAALEPILGLSSGMEQYCAATTTFTEGTGAMVNIMRLDCIIWARSVTAKSIKEKINTTLACVAYKSVVDVTKLSFDDFRAVYGPVMEASGEKDVFAALEKARKIYDALGGGTQRPTTNTLSQRTPLTVSDLIYRSNAVMASDGKF